MRNMLSISDGYNSRKVLKFAYATDVARSVVCLSVCWAHGCGNAKTAEPIEMPFGA